MLTKQNKTRGRIFRRLGLKPLDQLTELSVREGHFRRATRYIVSGPALADGVSP